MKPFQTISQRETLSRCAIPEAALHRAVAAYLRLALRPPTIWTTIGHGGGGKVRGAQLKAMGVQAGWPDIIIIDPTGSEDSFVLGVELKAAKGALSAEQKAMKSAFIAAGCAYRLCRSLEDVCETLDEYGIQLHARTNGAPLGTGKIRQS